MERLRMNGKMHHHFQTLVLDADEDIHEPVKIEVVDDYSIVRARCVHTAKVE
jgi:hypothetical protein